MPERKTRGNGENTNSTDILYLCCFVQLIMHTLLFHSSVLKISKPEGVGRGVWEVREGERYYLFDKKSCMNSIS